MKYAKEESNFAGGSGMERRKRRWGKVRRKKKGTQGTFGKLRQGRTCYCSQVQKKSQIKQNRE